MKLRGLLWVVGVMVLAAAGPAVARQGVAAMRGRVLDEQGRGGCRGPP